jgi:putative ABC transport system permease protein
MIKRPIKRPPRIVTWILKSILPFHAASHGPGDYEEIYRRIAQQEGTLKARCWYVSQVCRSIPPFLANTIYWRIVMFKNYLKITVRNIMKHKAYSSINIVGLALGMAVCILIIGYILDELSFDRYHTKADRIYRLGLNGSLAGNDLIAAISNAPTAPALRAEFSEIENTVRFGGMSQAVVTYQNLQFTEEGVLFADNSVFGIFTYPLLRGDAKSALRTAYSVVITEDIAVKYFGDVDPVGKTLLFNNQDEYTVTGVMENVPSHSHLTFDMLCSFETYYAKNRRAMEAWVPFNYYTYVLLQEDADYEELEKKLPMFVEKTMGPTFQAMGATLALFLQPLTRIHLHSNLEYDTDNSDISYVYIFSAIAVFILFIGCINFMNLATARSVNRAKEVGIRKVLGSVRSQLIRQFMGESMMTSFISLMAAVLLVHLTLPLFRSVTGREFSLHFGDFPWLIPGYLLLALIVGLVAGSYPAFFLSAFKPVRIFQRFSGKTGSHHFRNILVVIQFAISIILIIGTVIITRQLVFMKNRGLGFDKEHVVVLPIRNSRIPGSLDTFKEELKKSNGVMSVAASSHVPGQTPFVGPVFPEGYPEGQSVLIRDLNADCDFVPTMGMEMIAGRNFSREFSTDSEESVIINETAAQRLGWDDPVGKKIYILMGDDPDERSAKTIIGVFRDIHMVSLHKVIEPMYINNQNDRLGALSIRIREGDVQETLTFLEAKWKEAEPNRPFDYYFLDESFDSHYRREEKLSTIFSYFTAFTLLVACLGLFGLASFTAEQRTKEIGIRKVLGSSIVGILFLLIKEFTKWVVVANIVAWPLAYFALHRWLQHFAYRTDMSLWMFLLSGVLALLIALITVGYQAVKAARANPVMSLRYE